MSRIETPQGAPRSLIFELPSTMIDSTKTENRIQPYGNSNFDTAGQVIRLVVPRTERAFLNTGTCYITGEVNLTGTFGTATTELNYILGTYWSLFSRYVVSSNGKVLETIEKPSELINAMLNMTMNRAEKCGLANSLGYYVDNFTDGDVTTNICQPINTTVALAGTTGRNFTFAIPLIGILNSTKMWPLINGDITIELTVNAKRNYMTGNTAASDGAIGTIISTIKNVELVFDQLQLSPDSYNMVMAAYPDKIDIKSESFDFGTGQPFANFSGALDIPINIKRSSLKKVIMYFTQEGLIDRTYGGINPNGGDLQLLTGGQSYPMRPLKLNNPSEMYMQIQKSFGSIYSTSHSGSIGKSEFCRRNVANDLYATAIDTAAQGSILVGSNKFYICIDTEVVNYSTESLYSGVAMGVNSNFRLNIINQTSAASITPYYWLNYDVVVRMDLVNGITSVIA